MIYRQVLLGFALTFGLLTGAVAKDHGPFGKKHTEKAGKHAYDDEWQRKTDKERDKEYREWLKAQGKAEKEWAKASRKDQQAYWKARRKMTR
ncbi:MAG TPA: hypothetical protein VMZ52_16560 [Bryobacteraceae bacterium]|nr:hypothetical protein [Bryobacteraceae bacterium]